MIESKAMPCSARLKASSRCSGSVAWSRCTEIGTEAEWALRFVRSMLVQEIGRWQKISQLKAISQEMAFAVGERDGEQL